MSKWIGALEVKLATVIALAGATISLVGCHSKPPVGEVSGRVTVAGAPVQYGTIAFLTDQGAVAAGNIINGDYHATGVPAGAVKVSVQAVKLGTPVGNPKFGPLPSSAPPGPFVAVPMRYGSPQTSQLQFEVVDGPQSKNFDLAAK